MGILCKISKLFYSIVKGKAVPTYTNDNFAASHNHDYAVKNAGLNAKGRFIQRFWFCRIEAMAINDGKIYLKVVRITDSSNSYDFVSTVLDPTTGDHVLYNGKIYYGQELYKLYEEFQMIETEKALEVLE